MQGLRPACRAPYRVWLQPTVRGGQNNRRYTTVTGRTGGTVARPQPTTAEWTILAGAAATFVGSFLDAAGGANAWGSGSFSVLKLVPIYAIAVGGVVAIRRYLGADLPERVGPFTWPQLLVVVAGFGTLMAAAWVVAIESARRRALGDDRGIPRHDRRDRRRRAGRAPASVPVQPARAAEGAPHRRESGDPRRGRGDDPRFVPPLLEAERRRRSSAATCRSTHGIARSSSRSRSSRCCARPS